MSQSDEIAFVTTNQTPEHYHVDPKCSAFPDCPKEIMDTSDLLPCSVCVKDKSPAERIRDHRRGSDE